MTKIVSSRFLNILARSDMLISLDTLVEYLRWCAYPPLLVVALMGIFHVRRYRRTRFALTLIGGSIFLVPLINDTVKLIHIF